jgi:hypothetical protein
MSQSQSPGAFRGWKLLAEGQPFVRAARGEASGIHGGREHERISKAIRTTAHVRRLPFLDRRPMAASDDYLNASSCHRPSPGRRRTYSPAWSAPAANRWWLRHENKPGAGGNTSRNSSCDCARRLHPDGNRGPIASISRCTEPLSTPYRPRSDHPNRRSAQRPRRARRREHPQHEGTRHKGKTKQGWFSMPRDRHLNLPAS